MSLYVCAFLCVCGVGGGDVCVFLSLCVCTIVCLNPVGKGRSSFVSLRAL